MPLRICMIGNGSVLRSSIEIAQQNSLTDLGLVLLRAQEGGWHNAIASFCAGRGIACRAYDRLDDPAIPAAIAECRPDLLVSVHNPDILPDRLLRTAALAINYHPAPLPRFAGLHPFSWALLHGETRYGVTWHVLTPKIDAGDIVAQAHFPIEPSWNVVELIRRCAAPGCELFRDLLAKIAVGERNFRPQDLAQRSYFSGKMKPFGGRFPFTAAHATIVNLQRATSYFPGPNPFCMPSVTVNGTAFELVRFRLDPGSNSAPAGTIVHLDESGLRFAVAGGTMITDLVRAADAIEAPAWEFAHAAGLKVGQRADLDERPYGSNGLELEQVAQASWEPV
jgi:methionyl-tRNA formyltransferase